MCYGLIRCGKALFWNIKKVTRKKFIIIVLLSVSILYCGHGMCVCVCVIETRKIQTITTNWKLICLYSNGYYDSLLSMFGWDLYNEQVNWGSESGVIKKKHQRIESACSNNNVGKYKSLSFVINLMTTNWDWHELDICVGWLLASWLTGITRITLPLGMDNVFSVFFIDTHVMMTPS